MEDDKRRLGWLIPVALVSGAMCATKCWTYDTWWHVASGRWILEHGKIPSENVFSHTFPTHPLLTAEWLGDLVYFGAFATLGFAGLLILKIACATLVSLMIGLRARRMGAGPIVIAACLVFAAILLQPRLSADRPLILSYGFTALQLWLLESYRFGTGEGAPAPRSRLTLFLLVALPWVWVAVHGYAILSVGFSAAFVIEALLNQRKHPEAPSYIGALSIVTVSALCALALTPWGRGIVVHSWELQTVGIQATINEWRPAAWADLVGRDSARIILLILGLVVSLRRRDRLADTLLLLAVLVLGMRGRRFFYLGVVVATPIVAHGLHVVVCGYPRWRRRASSWAFALLICVIATLGYRDVPIEVDFGLGLSESAGFPVQVVEEMRELDVRGPIFNSMRDGGYLAFFAPEYPVFLDGRGLNAYPAGFFELTTTVIAAEPERLVGVLDQWGIEASVVPAGPLADIISLANDRWSLLYADETHQLFVRVDGPNAELARRRGIAYFRMFESAALAERWYRSITSTETRCRRLAEELAMARAEWPPSTGLNDFSSWASQRCGGTTQD